MVVAVIDPVWPILLGLRETLCNALTNVGDPAGRCSVINGELAWDDCECGLAWVREINRFPSTTFPIQDQMPLNSDCTTPWAVIIEIGVLRCVPVVDDQGGAPPAGELESAAEILSADTAVLIAVTQFAVEGETYLIGATTPIGPQGGCGGVQMTLTVQFVPCAPGMALFEIPADA